MDRERRLTEVVLTFITAIPPAGHRRLLAGSSQSGVQVRSPYTGHPNDSRQENSDGVANGS